MPISDPLVTSSSRIKVTFANPVPSNGGSAIISYELQMDDGLSGEFSSIVGYSVNSLLTAYTVTSGIVKGREYRFRYRVRNSIGWSDFSDESAILAATIPSPPGVPKFSNFYQLSLYVNI